MKCQTPAHNCMDRDFSKEESRINSSQYLFMFCVYIVTESGFPAKITISSCAGVWSKAF